MAQGCGPFGSKTSILDAGMHVAACDMKQCRINEFYSRVCRDHAVCSIHIFMFMPNSHYLPVTLCM